MINDIGDNLLVPVFKVTSVSTAQVIVFVVLYEASVEIYVSNVGAMNRIFGFGMQMDYGVYLLSILAGVQSLAYILLKRIEQASIATILCVGVWIAYWGNVADVVPNRFALLSILGISSFLIGVLLCTRPRPKEFV